MLNIKKSINKFKFCKNYYNYRIPKKKKFVRIKSYLQY